MKYLAIPMRNAMTSERVLCAIWSQRTNLPGPGWSCEHATRSSDPYEFDDAVSIAHRLAVRVLPPRIIRLSYV